MVSLSLTMSEFGCEADTVDMEVEIIKMPEIEFDANPEEGCADLEVEFTNMSTNLDEATFVWNFNGFEDTDTNAVFVYDTPGIYPVSLSVTNRALCGNALNKQSLIVVHEIPATAFDADPSETILEEATINFINNSSSNDILSYLWYFDDGDSSILENPVHTYTSEGVYRVYLVATTSFGCINLDSLDVRIHPDFAVYPANAFTPNGDGENDTFVVKGTGINSYNIKIFSRWGELIFESDDINDSWDGTYNGSPLPTGTYAYKINYQSMINIDYSVQGTVTIIR
jgi:gliding motility-associated-like protein